MSFTSKNCIDFIQSKEFSEEQNSFRDYYSLPKIDLETEYFDFEIMFRPNPSMLIVGSFVEDSILAF
jgi:hypothetical protein